MPNVNNQKREKLGEADPNSETRGRVITKIATFMYKYQKTWKIVCLILAIKLKYKNEYKHF